MGTGPERGIFGSSTQKLSLLQGQDLSALPYLIIACVSAVTGRCKQSHWKEAVLDWHWWRNASICQE
ncbi:hypothetical protein XELAEV_18020874mg [Xenopus laevis]|uniref:Uncharacterized protein n=1 Tax=Xenopus laevis TaxID=8355 RepID=A0A974D8I1_XENLA|nr:hypothetical protein XELAEV_18020874mg [Xenopus laevis]